MTHEHDTRALEDRLRGLHQSISDARSRRARDEVEVANAESALAEGKEALAALGISTSDELRSRVAELESEIKTSLEAAEKELQAAGA